MQNLTTQQQIEVMLDIWAQWAKSGAYAGVISNIRWLQEMGGVYTKGIGQKLPDDPIAEEMDSWIGQLMREKPVQAQALMLYYLGEGKSLDMKKTIRCAPIKPVIAKRLAISVRMIERRIKDAKNWLEGVFVGKKKLLTPNRKTNTIFNIM